MCVVCQLCDADNNTYHYHWEANEWLEWCPERRRKRQQQQKKIDATENGLEHKTHWDNVRSTAAAKKKKSEHVMCGLGVDVVVVHPRTSVAHQ